MNRLKLLTLSAGIVLLTAACEDPNSPGVEYMPDMYRSPSLETYQEYALFPDGSSARQPAAGTVPRGFMPYPFKDTPEDYERAGSELKNPLPFDQAHVDEGKRIYENFCMQCHGKKGAGDGSVASNPRWPGPPPAYDSDRLKDLPEGKIFHVITYGKGLMGPHKGQISQEDRWKVVYYVQTLQGKDVEAMYSGKEDVAEDDKAEQTDVPEVADEAAQEEPDEDETGE